MRRSTRTRTSARLKNYWMQLSSSALDSNGVQHSGYP